MSAAARRDVAPEELAPGTRIDARFVIERLIGRGGMGAVYAARDERIGRRVALKVLHLEGRRAGERFRVEAAAASRISSRFVAAVHDYGRDEALDCAFLVMELLEGSPLDAILHAEGRLSPRDAAAIGADIAEALGAAHAAGVIHRDLKPGNVIVLAEGGVKVIDFGIARIVAPDGGAVGATRPDVMVGTPAYISPEMVAGEPLGPAADLYALGVVLFEMVAGRPPFFDPVASALALSHLSEPAPAIADVAPEVEVPAEYALLVSGLLAKDPDERPRSAAEVAAILRGLGGDTRALRLGRALAAADDVATATLTRASERGTRRRRHLLAAIAVACALIALLSVALVGIARAPTEPRAEPARAAPAEPALAPPDPAEPAVREPDAPALVEIAVAVVPEGAQLTLDGAPVTPPLRLPADATEHELLASASGHRPERRVVRGDRDRAVVIRLRPLARRPGLPAKLREW
ncbi:MAG: serine/threonine protein kinase [Sandaracinaceae bacterium]|nr:serine/threonine protein kinase [Sandaracinaceae bacterium]